MPDFENMADGYKAHLFEDLKGGNFRHLSKCGCWICSYRRQQLHRELNPIAEEDPETYESQLPESAYFGDTE
jgi:hypothetical protein